MKAKHKLFVLLTLFGFFSSVYIKAQIPEEVYTSKLPDILRDWNTDSTDKARFCFDDEGNEVRFYEQNAQEKIKYCILIEYVKGSAQVISFYEFSRFDTAKIFSQNKFIKISEELWIKKPVGQLEDKLNVDTVYTFPSKEVLYADTIQTFDIDGSFTCRIIQYYPSSIKSSQKSPSYFTKPKDKIKSETDSK